MQADSIDKQKLPEHVHAFFDSHIYPHAVKEIRLIQTHISWVFLTGDFAYKIKKPVDFGFLDFTTLVKRKKACDDELILNRRLAPDIYLNVLPVHKRDGAIQIGNDLDNRKGIVDYCLKMVQFDQPDLFDNRVESNLFDPVWMDQLAGIIAEFHQKAERNAYIEQFGDPQLLYNHIQENLHIAEEQMRTHPMIETLIDLKKQINTSFNASRQQLSMRQQGHHVRNCHGDLHLKNITLFNNKPTPFDCIEFSDAFRMIDTMNDVAFLIMDCDARKRSDLGYRFLSRYLEQTGDYEGLQLLPLYLSYRAGVRGKVSCLSASNATLQQRETSKSYNAVEDYFRLAAQYLLPRQPQLFMIGGLSGSGKSHLALLGLKHVKAIIIRSDATRKRLARQHTRLPLYGTRMHQLTYQAMFDAATTSIKAGFSVILDATFLHPASRKSAIELAATLHIPFSFYWLDIDPVVLQTRIEQRNIEASDISDADLNILKSQLREYQRPGDPHISFLQHSDVWPVKAPPV